jgi:hypothetical protein
MSNTVAIVAITSGTTLGVAAITVIASQAQARQRQASELRQIQARFHHERYLHDVDELRDMLDEAAEAIRSTRKLVANPTGPGWLDESLARLTPVESRLALRLPLNHPLTASAQAVVQALQDIENLYASAELNGEEDEDAFWSEFQAKRDEVAYSTDHFLETARETVGAHLSLLADDGES